MNYGFIALYKSYYLLGTDTETLWPKTGKLKFGKSRNAPYSMSLHRTGPGVETEFRKVEHGAGCSLSESHFGGCSEVRKPAEVRRLGRSWREMPKGAGKVLGMDEHSWERRSVRLQQMFQQLFSPFREHRTRFNPTPGRATSTCKEQQLWQQTIFHWWLQGRGRWANGNSIPLLDPLPCQGRTMMESNESAVFLYIAFHSVCS